MIKKDENLQQSVSIDDESSHQLKKEMEKELSEKLKEKNISDIDL